MKNLTRTLTVTAMLLIGMQLHSFQASAQISFADKEKLTEFSRINVINGDINFLIAEMLKDGLLKDWKNIYITYGNRKVTLNGSDVPEPFNSRYIQLLAKAGIETTGDGTGSIRTSIDSISELNGTAPSRLYSFNHFQQNYDRLIKLLVEDKIAGHADNLIIDIATDYVAVNGRILTTAIEKTYEYHFRKLSGFEPKEGEVFSIQLKHSSR